LVVQQQTGSEKAESPIDPERRITVHKCRDARPATRPGTN
jgi:hypothetical protein